MARRDDPIDACPPTCGAAAAVLVSPAFARKQGLNPAVQIVAQAMTTDLPNSFTERDMRYVAGVDMTRRTAEIVYEKAGVGPQDVQVIELHDYFAHNEVLTYDGLGLCEPGGAQRFIADGDNTYGGKYVTNPSGAYYQKAIHWGRRG